MKTLIAMTVCAAALVVAGCGGSDGDSSAAPAPTAGTDLPASATGSSAGLVSYVQQQVDASSDTAEPVLVGDAVLPIDDSTETSL